MSSSAQAAKEAGPSDSLQAYYNGNVLTMAPGGKSASAFSVSGGSFTRIGTDDEILKNTDARAELIDLKGKTVLPGFIETHNHLSIFAQNLDKVDCSTPLNVSIEDVKRRIKKKTESTRPGHWVLGYGFDDTLIKEHRHLTRADLDEASPSNPVSILHISAHISYANSPALEMAGITRDTPQPESGEIEKDAQGVASGVLFEPGAMDIVGRCIPHRSTRQIKSDLQKAIMHFNRFGITSIHDGGIGYTGNGERIIRAYGDLEKESRLNLRVYMTIIERLYGHILDLGFGTGFGSDMLKLGAVKSWLDGSIQIGTAALFKPYQNAPDRCGELLIPQETLDRLVKKYHRAGCQIAVHANGDRAIETALRAFEAADKEKEIGPGRHMIVHCQMAAPDQIERMKKMGLVPNYFVNHVYYWGDRHVSRFLGLDRAKRINPLGSSYKRGLRFCLHSDLPVTPVDPIFSIHCAVNRTTRAGRVLGERERIPVMEALKAYTINAAYSSFEERKKGSIEKGKLADFIVLSENPLNVPRESIRNIRVLRTVLDGRTVFEKDKQSA